MGRMMPVDCQHGVTIDWGDFGPCQDCDDHPGESCPNLVDCPECAKPARQVTPSQRLTLDQHIERLEMLRDEYRRQAIHHPSKNGRRRLFQSADGVSKAIRTILNGEHR